MPLPDDVVKKLRVGRVVELELASKALKGVCNVQPATPHRRVNVHGCCVNHSYRVPITLDPSATLNASTPPGDFENTPSSGKFQAPFRNLNPLCAGEL